MSGSELRDRLLQAVAEGPADGLDTLQVAAKWAEDHQLVVGALKSVLAQSGKNSILNTEELTMQRWQLTDEGTSIVAKGSHEAVIWAAVKATDANALPQDKLASQVGKDVAKVGLGKALSKGWVSMDKSSGNAVIRLKADKIDDEVQHHLRLVGSGSAAQVPDKCLAEYKKRKLTSQTVVKSYRLMRGSDFTTSLSQAETELTPEMIATGSWKDINFKPYNFNALGIQPSSGYLHPLLKVRAEFRQIFLEMGFTEMPTNNFIESSFWNFDALFQPQQHPARDAHDTFFLSHPAEATSFPNDYLQKVKQVHSKGGYGSQGYGYDWKLEEARKNLLRTHTTAVSARMLHQLADQGRSFSPSKYFSIDRVFRNETLDATHLAEFHQIEGVIADYGLTLGDLIGVLYEFFNKLGIKKLRFKPAYNPYTEPSMEIFSYHEGFKKWVEVGNSGLFRPEMLLPMGLPEGVNVIAWGLSLERPTMIKYGFNNIRELCGNKMSLKLVQDNPVCRLDKN